MAIPVSYSYRNLWTRKVTTIVTMLGISLVVFVFSAVLMLAYGLKKTLVATGSDDNVVIIRKSSESDVTSQVGRDSANLVETFPQVAHAPDGRPIATRDVVVIINLIKYATGDKGNVIVRGVSPDAVKLRPSVKLLQGQFWQPGTTQIIIGSSISKRFKGCQLGDTIKFGSREWLVVGIFEANKTGFESEIWCDVDRSEIASKNGMLFGDVPVPEPGWLMHRSRKAPQRSESKGMTGIEATSLIVELAGTAQSG